MGKERVYLRALRPLPVYRGAYWELLCADCGAQLNISLSAGQDGTRHLESWKDGCTWVAQHYVDHKKSKQSHMKATGIFGKFVARVPTVSVPMPSSRAKAEVRWEAIKDDVIQSWLAGEGIENIARRVHMAKSVIYARLKSSGVKKPSEVTIESYDDAIVGMWKAGVTQKAIAARLGYSIGHVSRRLRVLRKRELRQAIEERGA